MARWTVLSPLLAALLSLPIDAGAQPVVRSDSAGIALVRNTPQAMSAAATWTLSPNRTLETGSDPAAPTLFQVGDVKPAPGGAIAVVNRSSQQVLMFDGSGAHVRTLGRKGGGPGEFTDVSGVAAVADTLVVYDWKGRRISFFAPNGSFLRSARVPDEVPLNLVSLLALADGSLVLLINDYVATSPTPRRGLAESLRLSRTAAVLGRYGPFPGTSMIRQTRAGSSTYALMPALFGASTVGATMGNQLIVGTRENPELRFFTPDGKLARVARWPDHSRQVTEARYQQYSNLILERVPPERRAQVRRNAPEPVYAPVAPPFENLLVSDEGDIWIGAYPGPEPEFLGVPMPSKGWVVLDGSGAVKARLTTPAGFDARFVRQGQMVGVFKDALGVESIRAFRIVKGGN